MNWRIHFSSNAQAILRQVAALPSRMANYIARAMDKENQLTVGRIQREELSGPRPGKIGVITNRLRGSVRAVAAVVLGNSIESGIGSNVVYAGPLERGFSGSVTVSAHSRAISNPAKDGGKTFDTGTGRIQSAKKRKSNLLGGRANVRAHQRKVNIRARHYIEGTLDRSATAYSTSVSRAIEAAWDGGEGNA